MRVSATGRPDSQAVVAATGTSPPGGGAARRTFTTLPGAGRYGAAALIAAYAVDDVGAFVSYSCATFGSSNMTTMDAGGSASRSAPRPRQACSGSRTPRR